VKPAPEHDESVHGPVHVTRSPTAVLADDHFTAAELALVSALVAAAPVLDPSALARARMQVRVLAGAGIVDAAARGSDGVVVDLGRRPSRTVRTPLGMRARFLVAAAAALCLVVALSGISLLLSRDALPGDALYSLKRAGENTRLELTFGDTDRGLRHLDYASRRVDEVVALLERGSGSIDSAITLGLIQAFDAQTTAGSTRLTSSGVAGDATTLKSLFSWAQGQSSRLVALRPQLSTTTAQRLDASLTLLTLVQGRAEALSNRLSCSPITSGALDQLGPLPADGCAAPSDPVPASARVTLTDAPAPATAPGAGAPSRGSVPSTSTPPALGTATPTTNGAPAPGPATAPAPGPGGTPAAGPGGPPAPGPGAPTPATSVPGGGGLVTAPTPPAATTAPPGISLPVPLPPATLGPIPPGLLPGTVGGRPPG